jgi:hypothetical protein
MGFWSKGALLLVFCASIPRVALAREKEEGSESPYSATGETSDSQQREPSGFRPLNRSEGSAILKVALNSRHHADYVLDCSHLVHELYERAGFRYEYASSSDLYEGIEEFRRVATPQAGDLAVWRGHVGIVVDPAQRSFYSVLHSGPGVDYYDSPYWKRRGRPRFFRYAKPVPRGGISNTIQSANWRPAISGHVASREIAVDEGLPDISQQSSKDISSSAMPAENRAANSELRVVIVNSARPKPDQVTAAFLQACKDLETSLRGRGLLKSAPSLSAPSLSPLPLIVFDNFKVEKLHIGANQGWVEVRIDEVLSVSSGKLDERKGSNRQRWPLTRENKRWKLTPERNAIYIPQRSAERIFSHELAQLTENSSDNNDSNHEKAELARLLNLLFDKE